MRTDGLLTIQYRNKLNEDMEADAYLPDYPELSGNNYLMKNNQKPNYISFY